MEITYRTNQANPEVELAVEFLKGLFAGAGVNYFWEILELPGYGESVFTLIPEPRVDVGVDDIVEMGIGGGIAVAGYLANRTDLVAFGGGFAVGVFLTKIAETRKYITTRGEMAPASKVGAQPVQASTQQRL